MVNNKVSIAVDRKFFKNIFEQQRKQLQKQLGLMNLSQANFTKMIKGFEIKKVPTENPINIKPKRGKRNDFFKF